MTRMDAMLAAHSPVLSVCVPSPKILTPPTLVHLGDHRQGNDGILTNYKT